MVIFVYAVSLYSFNKDVIPNRKVDIIFDILSVIIMSYFAYIFKFFVELFIILKKQKPLFIHIKKCKGKNYEYYTRNKSIPFDVSKSFRERHCGIYSLC